MIAAPRPGAAAVVDRVLAETRALTLQTLLELIPRDPRLSEFYETVVEYPLRASKAIRPALCLAASRAHGGTSEDAIGAATAIELMHSAFLVHDDICDGAARRRGAPALHVRHGLPLALTAGDALAWLALEPLLASADRLGGGLALDVLAELQHMTRRTIEGQAAELAARQRPPGQLGTDDYLRVVLDKTCWYSAIHPCRVGALIGSRGEADLDAIARFGFFLGAVLQIRDDIENVTDRDELGGKEFGGDVIEGKPTLMLIHLRGAMPPDLRTELDGLVGPLGQLSGAPGEPERVERVVGLMQEHGSIDYACAFADGLAGAALAEFDAAMGWLPESEDKLFLRSVVLHLRDPAVRGR
ncbi:MAG: polyprenyl synthetase family protein [Actinomycetota bacterium]|nr:polyprenyl synthetase family protein [Actinomycetota bacterium]